MKIELTKAQYRKLLLLAHLGEGMINGYKTENRDEEASELLHHLCAHARDFGEMELVDPKSDKGRYWGTNKLDELEFPIMDEYDNETFWEELLERFVDREVLKCHGTEKLKRMSIEDRLQVREEFEDRFSEEFETYGIERLEIVQPNPFLKG